MGNQDGNRNPTSAPRHALVSLLDALRWLYIARRVAVKFEIIRIDTLMRDYHSLLASSMHCGFAFLQTPNNHAFWHTLDQAL